jgi:hypothetical protein
MNTNHNKPTHDILNSQPSHVQGSNTTFGINQINPSYVQGIELEDSQEYLLNQQPHNGRDLEQGTRLIDQGAYSHGFNPKLRPTAEQNRIGLEQRTRPDLEQRTRLIGQSAYSRGPYPRPTAEQQMIITPGKNGLGLEQRMIPAVERNGLGVEQRTRPAVERNGLGVEQRTRPAVERNGLGVEQRMIPAVERNGLGVEQRTRTAVERNGLGVEQRTRPGVERNGLGVEQRTRPGVERNGLGVEQRTRPVSEQSELDEVYNYEQPSYNRNNNEDILCMDNVCYNKYDGGSLNPNDRDFSYSGFNFGLSTKLQYDPCFINDDIEQSTKPLMSILDPNRVKNNEQCLSTLGPRAGHNGYGDNIPIENPGLTPAQELVDIDSIMSNRNVKQSRCKNGNVNPIDVFKFKTYNSKECNNLLNPLETINSDPKQNYREISINRFYDLNINPQVNIYYDGAVNTQLEAKDNFSNPYPYFLSENSSNTVKGKPIEQFVNVYDNKTNSLLTGTNGQKYKL